MKKTILLAMLLSTLFTHGQWSVDSLPDAKFQLEATAHGDHIYMVGGRGGITLSTVFNTVEVYNTATGQWEPNLPPMPLAKSFVAAVHGDSALYVFGGLSSLGSFNWVGTNTVMIYKNGAWDIDTIADSVFSACGVKVGSKILFAGGIKRTLLGTPDMELSNKVYIYDEFTGQWSVDTLSQPRNGLLPAVSGDIAIFPGGENAYNSVTNIVDIYNASTNSWTTDTLGDPRVWACAVQKNGVFYIAGGNKAGLNNSSAFVDKYDGNNFTQMPYQLSDPRGYIRACTIGDLIIFAGGADADLQITDFTNSSNAIDIYNVTTNTWSINSLDHPIVLHTAISNQGKAMIIGGLEWDTSPSGFHVARREIYIWSSPADVEEFLSRNAIRAYPNPAVEQIVFEWEQMEEGDLLEIYSEVGQLVQTEEASGAETTINVRGLASGVYILKVAGTERSIRFIKK